LSKRASAIVADSSLAEEKRQADLKELFESYYPTLADSVELYRQQCLHCHGVEGGGDGPTAGPRDHPFLDPRPRDYRRGIFKFTAVKDKARPRREDLFRVIDQGVYGTAMPSFRRFSMAERWGLVDYVRMLAIRGEVEHNLALACAEDPLSAEAPAETFKEVWDKWQEAKSKVVVFEGGRSSADAGDAEARRRALPRREEGNCASCHGDRGSATVPRRGRSTIRASACPPTTTTGACRSCRGTSFRASTAGQATDRHLPTDLRRDQRWPMPGIGPGRENLVLPPMIVGDPALDLGMKANVDRPQSVGADRLCNTVAAHQRYKGYPWQGEGHEGHGGN
jgi:mono/diheme cytochrome c family protein